VRHPRPYFELDLTSGGAHPLRHAHGIIEEGISAYRPRDRISLKFAHTSEDEI
jgi:hypothetical protein